MTACLELVEILLLARQALAGPENDFAWSDWVDANAALAEIDGLVASLRNGANVKPLDLQVLFAATGPICEVSLSSGWSDGYLRLAQRFDIAFDQFLATSE
jgi:hypothetical protein